MSEKIIIQPIQAKLTIDTDITKKMDPYCEVTLGDQKDKTYVAHALGKFPYWNSTLTFNKKENENVAKLVIKDKDTFTRDDFIGEVTINIDEVLTSDKVSKWFFVTNNGKTTGEVLVQIKRG